MERELIVERTRAGLEVARLLGRKGGRKAKMTDSKIESAKKLLIDGVLQGTWPRTLACPFLRFTAWCRHSHKSKDFAGLGLEPQTRAHPINATEP